MEVIFTDELKKEEGGFGSWLALNKKTKHLYEIEVPGNLGQEQKTKVVEIVLDELVLPEFKK